MHAHHETTANKQRPQVFSELTGQDFVVNTLIGSLATDAISHAYLFSGPRGVGKTSAARLLALALNRPSDTDISKLQYKGSEDIRHGRSLDVIEIDGASYTSVENIRNIREEILYKPVQFLYKVYIIDEVHMLSTSAFNALLKTIEEPPEYVVFIFATTELHKVPPTIRSRCQQFAFRKISSELITAKLQQLCDERTIQAEKDALMWIAKESDGSLRDAYMLFDQVVSFSNKYPITMTSIKKNLGLVGVDTCNTLFTHCVKQDKSSVLEIISTMYTQGISSEQIIFEASEYMRNILFIKSGISSTSLIGYAVSQFDTVVYETLTQTQIEHALELLLECYRNIRYTTNQRFEIELTFSLLCSLSSYVTPMDLVARLEQVQRIHETPDRTSSHTIHKPTVQQSSTYDTPRQPEKTQTVHETIQQIQQRTHKNGLVSKQTQPLPHNEQWERVLMMIQEQDERLSTALEAVQIHQTTTALTITFLKQFAASLFEKHTDIITQAIRDVYGDAISITTRMIEKNSTPVIAPQKQKMITSITEKKEQNHSSTVSSLIDIFGGDSVTTHE